ncbi:1-deoxy-D-xylulose-5-phosphate reductoisomerase [Yoonia vestfoldensis]|uniref:1-deoxy-D-xylulose 5-phosphate reductoisomerase n=1 Tax=Yoonia vestfoldensis SKA53 TaxID=314232 RepID=A3V5Q4_9RHOB|nr:1-deoxy-D-xylulose-5-phosphate reductoisomerase [Yoonia vestfoldensis]EAQ06228.1 1-deoxy-D-xylulose 5-phosphate reductoisomerase [Yoonia vestfoldensis SKA53]
MRRITLFGATGSVGQSAVDLIARDLDAYQVVALTGGRNIQKLASDAIALRAELAVTCHDDCYAALKDALAGTGIAVAAGDAAIKQAAMRPVDWALSAIIGSAGLVPGMIALDHGTTLALANKESLVTAGPVLMARARAAGATILPVDSEHSAVFQALVGEDMAAVERIIITASGGAFRDWPKDKLASATLAQASSHPNWDMGQRITIDSASMFNKAMELIETKEFFGVPSSMIEVLVHRESLIHALVGFNDGALMAHVGPPDMRHAIGYALHWPDRRHLPVERLDLAKIGSLSFQAPDEDRYPALALARQVMDTGGLAGAVFNAAKERALDAFIAGQIGFLQMSAVVSGTLDKMSSGGGLQIQEMTLDDVLEADRLARIYAGEITTQIG